MARLVAMATIHEKKSNDISYENIEPILMKFHIKHLYDGYTKFSLKGHDPIFKMAALPIYGKNHLNDFFSRTTGLIWLIFCLKHMEHLPVLRAKLVSIRS